jgi:hypothetical protein
VLELFNLLRCILLDLIPRISHWTLKTYNLFCFKEGRRARELRAALPPPQDCHTLHSAPHSAPGGARTTAAQTSHAARHTSPNPPPVPTFHADRLSLGIV